MATASRILYEVDAQLGPVTISTEQLQTLLNVMAAWLTIVTIAMIVVAMEMCRQWRQEKNDMKRAEWMNRIGSQDSDVTSSTDDEHEYYNDVTDDEEIQENNINECRPRARTAVK